MIKIDCDAAHLELYHHVNIICGNDIFASGEKKSYFYDHLLTARNNKKLKSNKLLVFLQSPMDYVSINFTEDTCLILDEANFSPQDLDNLFKTVRTESAFIIVIGRLFVKQLECSVDAIYSVNYTDTFSIERVFKNSNRVQPKIDRILNEDSTSVAAIYSECLRNEVVPVFGRSNFYKYVKNEQHVLLIADKPKFGQELISLIYRLCREGGKTRSISGYYMIAFEQVIASMILNNYSEVLKAAEESFDSETYFEQYLKENVSLWDKKQLQESLKRIKSLYCFDKSEVLMNLVQFAQNEEFQNEYTYFVDINTFSETYKKIMSTEMAEESPLNHKICDGSKDIRRDNTERISGFTSNSDK